MAKSAGDVRCSKWKGDIYTVDGIRQEYTDLPQERKDIIKAQTKEIGKELFDKLKGKTVTLDVDGEKIEVGFNRKGVDHIVRDSMIILSGKYFSKNGLLNIDKVLAKSEYVKTDHVDDGHNSHHLESLWFRFKDSTGRGVFFKVRYDKQNKTYSLYSICDQ